MEDLELQREALIEIVGTQYEGRIMNHVGLRMGQLLQLRHQADNPYDPNAVSVLAGEGKELGYIPRGQAAVYAPAIDSRKYQFTVEIVKTEPDPVRPILIVKITAEYENLTEDGVEQKIVDFVQTLINEYAAARKAYLRFIKSETVDIQDLAASLNEARMLRRLYALSSPIIEKYGLKPTAADGQLPTKAALEERIHELHREVQEMLKTLQKLSNDAFNIDDEDEFQRVQNEVRVKRKIYRKYDQLCEQFHAELQNFLPVNLSDGTAVAFTEQPASEPTAEPKENDLSEQCFIKWQVQEGGVSNATAQLYCSNIRSIEKLYQTAFGERKPFFDAPSKEALHRQIVMLMIHKNFRDADRRRNHGFSNALLKFARFAGIALQHTEPLSEKPALEAPLEPEMQQSFADKQPPAPPQAEPPKTKQDTFSPDLTVPFDLKTALVALLSSEEHQIAACRGHKGGMMSSVLQKLIKEYYHKSIGIFEITRLLMSDGDFLSVGKQSYILNPAMRKPPEEPAEPEHENAQLQPDVLDHIVMEQSKTPPVPSQKVDAETIVDIIRRHKDSIYYRDGFDAYTVKNLLAKENMTGVSEAVIEQLLSASECLQVAGDGYYMYKEENDSAPAAAVPVPVMQDVSSVSVPEKEASAEPARRISLRINGEVRSAYDCTDALKKICEFAINCKPFKMARIAGQSISVDGRLAFYRRAVPVDGYHALSNGLQMIPVSTVEELAALTEQVVHYCELDKDDVVILSQ